MRISLDYYRILSVPIKATVPQLEQAYSDRIQQQPRREYGKQAIAARLRLIQDAYQILSDSESRGEYDAQFFVRGISLKDLRKVAEKEPDSAEFGNNAMDSGEVIASSTVNPRSSSVAGERAIAEEMLSATATSTLIEPPPVNPTLEISPENFVGALLILHELGEYELVLKLGSDYLNSAEYAKLQKKRDKEAKIADKNDIILSLALAYLELGREQWHRREYENAALSSQMGIELLVQESLFPSVKEELEIDLYKLRPYRILELIAQNPANSPERSQGFTLVTEMLQQRQGIEGKGEDRSGLTFDQFLCFIQQLRTYLTSVEQEQLFATESPYYSAIASYLAVYALLARGFVLKQPQLVLRAQNLLKDLSQRQDVYWEKAICALLLGHTQKAMETLRKSQDQTNIELIRKQDPENKDLLPGLCFYGEKWLQEEVVSQFCDLELHQLTLKEYFADREVQAYLEQLSLETVAAQKTKPQTKPKVTTPSKKKESQGFLARWRKKFTAEAQPKGKVASLSQGEVRSIDSANAKSATATLEPNQTRINHPSAKIQNLHQPQRKKYSISAKSSGNNVQVFPTHKSAVAAKSQTIGVAKKSGNSTQKTQKKPRSKSTILVGWLFLSSLVVGVGGVGFLTMKAVLAPSFPTVKREAQLTIAVDRETVKLPPKPSPKPAPKPVETFEIQAKKVIQTWLDSKSAAFGKEYKIDELNKILAAPLLNTWRDRAVAYQKDKLYREYEHTITMRSAKIDPNNAQKAIVDAEVKEIAKHFQGGQLNNSLSYNDNLLVRYHLILQGDKWLIQNAEVLKTL